ncbi:hybrid sensor histidine kinase/response regulator [Azospirillum canadense]|uniref:hybrid sensor histidine kinase/response regulator n=1 Tax=Azospirillum canadense TaxID=403962 RepID=UPI002227654B|nr:hybrid sensor histidine kinase/response regulator [Azospirillum canadense]MCW2237779.1 CheY-like chemotaxis protein [Azospirillum canadense]
MTKDGGIRQDRQEAGAVLVFDATGGLLSWDRAAAERPGAAGRLVRGARPEALACLFDADGGEGAGAGPGVTVTDWPLSDGGFVRRVTMSAPSRSSVAPALPMPVAPMPATDPSGRLFAAASHDLRQPLAALSLLLGALEGRIDAGRGSPPRGPGRGAPGGALGGAADAALRDLVKAMGNAIQSMRGMVDGHFDLVRLEAGLVQPDVGSPVVNGILTRIALDAAQQFADRGLRFSVLPCSVRVRTDASLLERILQGFVGDTLRHTERGRVVLGCRRRGGDLRIELWATGRGLTPDQLDALRRGLGDGADDAPEGGGGAIDLGAIDLGLRLARGLARRLGHRIEVGSVAGRGTMVAVVLPRATDAAEDAPAPAPEPAGEAPAPGDISRARVLVVEDDPMVLDALDALLSQWGCAVIGAESVDAALERLGPGERAPDLVISDLRLKGAANGIVAIRQIAKALDSEVPGLILTGDTDPMRLREARLSGYPLLHKPVAALALRAAVARLLGRDRLRS